MKFWLLVALAACSGKESDSDTDIPADTDTDTDSDSDTDTDSDTDSDTDTDTETDTDETDSDTDPVDTDDTDDSDTDDTDVSEFALIDGFEIPNRSDGGTQDVSATAGWALSVTGSATVAYIDIYGQGPGSLAGPLTVALVNDDSGPTGTVIASVDEPASAFPDGEMGWTRIEFPPDTVITGHTWIRLTVPENNGSVYLFNVWNTGVADQMAFKDGSDPWSIYIKTYEQPFRVYGTAILE